MGLVIKQILVKADNTNTEDANLTAAMNLIEAAQKQQTNDSICADVFFASNGKIVRIFTGKSVKDYSMKQSRFDILDVPTINNNIKSAADAAKLASDGVKGADTSAKNAETKADSAYKAATSISSLNNTMKAVVAQVEALMTIIDAANVRIDELTARVEALEANGGSAQPMTGGGFPAPTDATTASLPYTF